MPGPGRAAEGDLATVLDRVPLAVEDGSRAAGGLTTSARPMLLCPVWGRPRPPLPDSRVDGAIVPLTLAGAATIDPAKMPKVPDAAPEPDKPYELK